MTAISQPRTWTILRQRLAADMLGLPLVWGLFVVAIALLVSGVALFRSGGIEVSGWEQAAQLARWYAGAVGVYLTAVYLPLYLAHGYTRREYAGQAPVFIVIFAAAFALLMTLGYAIETLAYRAFGWSQALTGPHLFDSPTQYPLVFTEFLLLGGAWTVAGAVLGAAFYRNVVLALGLVPVAIAMVGMVEATTGPRYFGPIPAGGSDWLPLTGPVLDAGPPALAAAVTVGVLTLGLGLMWALVRDLPVRTTP